MDQAQSQLALLRQGLDTQGQEDLKLLGLQAGPWASEAYWCPQENEGLASCKVLMFGNVLSIKYAIFIKLKKKKSFLKTAFYIGCCKHLVILSKSSEITGMQIA